MGQIAERKLTDETKLIDPYTAEMFYFLLRSRKTD